MCVRNRTFLALTDWSAEPVHGLRDFIDCSERPKTRIRLDLERDQCRRRPNQVSLGSKTERRPTKALRDGAALSDPVDPPLNAVSPEEGPWQNCIGSRGSDLRWQ